jgi:hypothetical protein
MPLGASRGAAWLGLWQDRNTRCAHPWSGSCEVKNTCWGLQIMRKQVSILVLVSAFFLGRYWFLNRTVYRDHREFESSELNQLRVDFGLLDTTAFPNTKFAFLAQHTAPGDEHHAGDMRLALVETVARKIIMTEIIQYSKETNLRHIEIDTISNDALFDSLKGLLCTKAVFELKTAETYMTSCCPEYRAKIYTEQKWNAFSFSTSRLQWPFGVGNKYDIIRNLFFNRKIFTRMTPEKL